MRIATVVLSALALAGCESNGENGNASGPDASGPGDGCAAVLEFRAAAGTEQVKGLSKQGAVAAPVLVYLMTGDDTATAIAAAEEIAKLGTDGIPALVALLESRAPQGRGWAAWALGEMGKAAKGARPALEKAAKEPALRSAAEEALRKIGT
jgi:hypothetical protein